MRRVGTVVRGIRTPVIRHGDDLEEVVIDSLLKASESEGFEFRDRDVIAITEAVVGITQNNMVTYDYLVEEFKRLFPKDVGVIYPILSRNRFSFILRALAQASEEVHILFSYPSDEVGNHLVEPELVYEKGVDTNNDVFDEDGFREVFGENLEHRFTGVDYIKYYKSLGSGNVHAHFSNNPTTILNYTKNVLVSDIHTRFLTKDILQKAGAKTLYSLDDICSKPVEGQGYNPEFGLLGSNKVTEDKLKLFPRDCDELCESIQRKLKEKTGKDIEVMVYGDGAFKDPVGKIWELADPVVSPGHTQGLIGTPNEIKLKYVSENYEGDNVDEYIKEKIREKDSQAYDLGTTPRRYVDLLGSLADLTSGSGDKGTPVVLVQGYFDNYTVDN